MSLGRSQKGNAMSLQTESQVEPTFQDRRQNHSASPNGLERRQFGNSHHSLSPDARELAQAIDNYKLQNRRRFITYEEMLNVIHSLGYSKSFTVS
jgi:hypothetical protein